MLWSFLSLFITFVSLRPNKLKMIKQDLHQEFFSLIDGRSTLQDWIELKRKISLLNLFSFNESKEEINDKYLKFMCLDFYIGKYLVDCCEGDRVDQLMQAKRVLNDFLDLMNSYGFQSLDDRKWLERVLEGKIQSPEVARDFKIQQFKREKAARIEFEV